MTPSTTEQPPIEKPSAEHVVDIRLLRKQSLNNAAVTVASQLFSTFVTLVSTVVLARMLTPTDYGIIAMVTAVTSFAGLFRDLGLSSAVVQRKTLTAGQQTNLFWLNVIMGALLTAVVVACAPLVSWIYATPALTMVTTALSLNFFITSLGTQSGALLARRMEFGRRAAAHIAGGIVSLFVAVGLASFGFGYWALVCSSLAGAASTAMLLLLLSPFRPGLPSREHDVREMLKFGAHVTAFDFVNYFHRNLDNVFIGRVWGVASLGLYSRAYALLMFPVQSIRAPINMVAFPAMSKLQEDPVAFRRYYTKVASAVALLSMPTTAFLAVSSKLLIELALGPKWLEVQPIFAVLAAVAFVQPTITLWGIVVQSRGLGREYLKLGMLNTCASVAGFGGGLPWGPIGVASGYALATYLSAYPILKIAFRGTDIKFLDFLLAMFRPGIASALAAGACMLLYCVLPPGQAFFSLAIGAFVFALVFSVSLAALPGGMADFLMAREVVGGIAQRFKVVAVKR